MINGRRNIKQCIIFTAHILLHVGHRLISHKQRSVSSRLYMVAFIQQCSDTEPNLDVKIWIHDDGSQENVVYSSQICNMA